MSSLSRILLVEDEALLLLDLSEQLAAHGIEAIAASNARAALHRLDAGVEALVTDIDLAGGPSGLDLARHVARLRPGLPILVVSGGNRPRGEDLPQGAAFLPKPCRAADIVAALERRRFVPAA